MTGNTVGVERYVAFYNKEVKTVEITKKVKGQDGKETVEKTGETKETMVRESVPTDLSLCTWRNRITSLAYDLDRRLKAASLRCGLFYWIALFIFSLARCCDSLLNTNSYRRFFDVSM